ncbi:NIF3-like protein 1 [Drosophila guanche]|uniref:NIF3-like protein 1 n=1 Tax=Drosophila guanche TaxID=7266 RepID=A0A3B0KB77_DROGU|nr:NIF3-like protein 1 [Drosophila guanche]SPP82311.1 blast:Putative GTP cyclohydrolase 1 type 2 [Drosophila guanche]
MLPVASTLKKMSSCSGRKLAAVVKELEAFAPISLAEKWDNVGLLIEPHKERDVKRILLTNDLTEPVMKEALQKQVEMIISYHPPIFKPLTRITQSNWKERVVAACLANSIALYSPHTAWDKKSGGVNDWLAQAVAIENIRPLIPEFGAEPGTGSGRLIETKMEVSQLVEALQLHIENNVHLALAVGHESKTVVRSVGICAGSGASVLRGIQADAIITGEMSHHEVLDFNHNGTSVLLCNHSNSERGFLRVFAPKLGELLQGACEILVSEKDQDPLVTAAPKQQAQQ